MQELNMMQVEEVSGGVAPVFFALGVVFVIGCIAYAIIN